jgi:hypothetical protein
VACLQMSHGARDDLRPGIAHDADSQPTTGNPQVEGVAAPGAQCVVEVSRQVGKRYVVRRENLICRVGRGHLSMSELQVERESVTNGVAGKPAITITLQEALVLLATRGTVACMRNTLVVSCVIPVFNGERFLAEAIASVLEQSVPVAEVIVADDGSTDATQAVTRSFGSRVTYLRQENAGPSSARNLGISHASGDCIAFLDSDDRWHPEKTAIQMTQFEARAELALSSTYMRNFWSADVVFEKADAPEEAPNLASSLIVRRSLFGVIGLLDTSLKHRDLHEFVLRATDEGHVTESLANVLVERRIHDANMSRNRNAEGEAELLAIARARIARRRMPR